jgi:hypothetical protein
MPVMTRTARHHEMTISMIDSNVSLNNWADVGVGCGFASFGQDTARGRRHREIGKRGIRALSVSDVYTTSCRRPLSAISHDRYWH